MSTKVEPATYRFDAAKWLLVIGVVLGGVVLAGVAAAIALQTSAGSAAWDLAKEARVEIRKVVWPSREETTQTTLIVVAVVIFVALILWGLDSGLSWLIQVVIG